MVFKRKVYQKLLDWKKTSRGTRALLVEGARRIGKSTIVQEFAKKEYPSYLFIDFAQAPPRVLEYFRDHKSNLDELFMLLSLEYGVKLRERESLIVFDEVQRYPAARELIKYLVADGRYDYIETGSLISIKENVQGIVIPSEERKLKMYPMDFEEFCWAFGEDMLTGYIRECFETQKPLADGLHKKAMLLFKQYLLVGGMPQAVKAYLDGNYDFEAADQAKRDILELYRDDILKITERYRSKVLSIFDQIPGFLSKHEKRVKLSAVSSGSTIDQYAETFFWLGNSMICNECFLTSDPNVGLSLNEDRTYVKCYMGDTGLLVSHAFDENELADGELYKQIIQDKLSINKGMIYENAIAQMLTANGHKLYFYTRYSREKHRNDIEIDFILSNNSKLKYKMFPIEVKSSKRYTAASIAKFREMYAGRIGGCFLIHPKPLRRDGDKLCIPPYMTMCL